MTTDVAEFRKEFAAWLDSHADVYHAHRGNHALSLEDAATQGAGFIRALYDGGWNRWGWPEKAGGLGGNVLHRAAMYEQLFASGYRLPQRYYACEILAPALHHFAPHLAASIVEAARGAPEW